VPDLLVTAEAATFLRVSPGTLSNWRTRGIGPPFSRIGSRIIYSRDVLVAWVKAQERSSTTEAQ
jgi:hypothetical protein